MGIWKKKENIGLSPQGDVPAHVAIIMDGNGRWAQKRGLPRSAGHSSGAQTFQTMCRYLNRLGVKYATFYAFSTENWKRPQQEVDGIMKLFLDYLKNSSRYKDENISMRFLGDRSILSGEMQRQMAQVERDGASATGLQVNLAVNYGSRDELLRAARRLARECAEGRLSSDGIDEQTLEERMDTAGIPDVDLLIRSGGEYRLSNYLLWQCAYAELWFTDVLWPDFSEKDVDAAIGAYRSRQRRFGGVQPSSHEKTEQKGSD